MKRFKQYLLETINEEWYNPKTWFGSSDHPKLPNRRDYGEDEAETERWKADTQSFASGERKAAEEQTASAASRYKTLGNVETGLKVADAVTDTALSAGAIAVPGVGTALNAAVKGVKAGINVSQGNYGSAALNVADAALPYVGELAAAGKAAQVGEKVIEAGAQAAKTGTTALGTVEKTGKTLQTVGKFVRNPVATALEKGAELTGTTAKIAGETVKGIAPTTEVLSSTGAQLGRNIAAKAGIKIAAKEGEPVISRGINSAGQAIGQGIQTAMTNLQQNSSTVLAPVLSSMSSSASNFKRK